MTNKSSKVMPRPSPRRKLIVSPQRLALGLNISLVGLSYSEKMTTARNAQDKLEGLGYCVEGHFISNIGRTVYAEDINEHAHGHITKYMVYLERRVR